MICLAVVSLGFVGLFSFLRSALLHSVPSRVLERASTESDRDRIRPLLERAESLATSASVFAITFQIVFVILVLGSMGGEAGDWSPLLLTLIVSVPPLVFVDEVLPAALRGDRSDALLRAVLPAFSVLQRPLAAVTLGLEATRQGTMRLFRIPEKPRGARRVVEHLRDVIEDSDLEGELAQTERELIENVVEFHDVDVAEIMTPRTELTAADVEDGLGTVVRIIAESGHTRIPVFEGNLDTIVGVAYAQEILRAVFEGHTEVADLRSLLRPVNFVPETKLVSELLTEFRLDQQKMAVVLDEYGGTSGLVTMGDVVEEIVGDVREELGDAAPEPIRVLEDGVVEVQATTRISEVNEELELELPEEADFETLAGFVLSELGRFPKAGESFLHEDVEYTVTEANDRRVLVVRVRRLLPQRLG